jgi:NAD(P)-dependent dehydrogenase (short-subunit alcohol dehydrogenase family)
MTLIASGTLVINTASQSSSQNVDIPGGSNGLLVFLCGLSAAPGDTAFGNTSAFSLDGVSATHLDRTSNIFPQCCDLSAWLIWGMTTEGTKSFVWNLAQQPTIGNIIILVFLSGLHPGSPLISITYSALDDSYVRATSMNIESSANVSLTIAAGATYGTTLPNMEVNGQEVIVSPTAISANNGGASDGIHVAVAQKYLADKMFVMGAPSGSYPGIIAVSLRADYFGANPWFII